MPKKTPPPAEAARKIEADMARAEGAVATIKKALKDEYGVTSLKDAKALLTTLEQEAEQAQEDADAAYAEFEARWGEYIDHQ